MTENYQTLGAEQERESLFKFYNSLKTTKAKCQWGAKDCEKCKEEDCKMRPYLLKRPD